MIDAAPTKRKILLTLESRATYGYSKNVMLAMRDYPELEIQTLVTGMHLVPELGNSIDLIREDGFDISATVEMHTQDDERNAWSIALGQAIAGYAKVYQDLQPDIVLLSGDRVETLGCCLAAAYMGIPTAHIQAGDKSGHIDDSSRHAIGKFAHIHLASCEDSANRLRKMGEQEFRIFNVGAPQLDNIAGLDYKTDSVDINGNTVDLSKPYILVVQHPVMAEMEDAHTQIEQTLNACTKFDMPVYIIYPNSDLGYQKIVNVIESRSNNTGLLTLENVDREAYLSMLANAAVLVGNSSSGILEAPSFCVPVVNIGNRQRGRPQADNILNCGYSDDEIENAIRIALTDEAFRGKCKAAINPYGDGKSGPRICEVLRDIELNRKLVDKECTY
ncbi:UDP-N-acetyl-D-glucosamine 2-epimerase, UDP-hydrolysing [Candidatus Endobugula sertula]|uniref:UDP-N-acetyl-D-glucosamine 2-epimerase, UDP-hydrolysing n=1 Tax=Candidatus Endobugula sertula TaxID=62101 RepID=A0A1D2QPL9_9GAMM|nr:UDP-N-acetyl-D-glucosamine 2-epimerase, UDP-hydrolysing [Candidatus Endobugula sertula]